MRVRATALIGLCALLGSCAPASTTAELAGTYVLSIRIDTLHLDASGQYRRVSVDIGAGRVAVDTGRWRLSNDRRLVALAALPHRWPDHGRYDPASGTWHEPDTAVRRMEALTIRSTWTGSTTLDLKPELGWRYRRLQQK
ncbi:MAG: hypothetical protein FJ363_09615 [Gemmatimonadetes bacterium]|nr:hypothetical protein [Gemmatimonadota bacterium]